MQDNTVNGKFGNRFFLSFWKVRYNLTYILRMLNQTLLSLAASLRYSPLPKTDGYMYIVIILLITTQRASQPAIIPVPVRSLSPGHCIISDRLKLQMWYTFPYLKCFNKCPVSSKWTLKSSWNTRSFMTSDSPTLVSLNFYHSLTLSSSKIGMPPDPK